MIAKSSELSPNLKNADTIWMVVGNWVSETTPLGLWNNIYMCMDRQAHVFYFSMDNSKLMDFTELLTEATGIACSSAL